MPPPNDPGRIEVQLAFLSGQETAAFLQMKEAMKTAADFMAAFKTADLALSVERMSKAAQTMREESARLNADLEARRNQPRIPNLPGAVLLGQTEQEARNNVKAEADAYRVQAQKKTEDRQAKERDKLDEQRMTDAERAATHARSRLGLPGLEDRSENPDVWYNKIESLNPDSSGIRIPQYGEITVQNILDRVRQNRLDASRKHVDQYGTITDPEAHTAAGRQAFWAERLSRQAGNAAGAHALFRQTQRGTQMAQGFSGMLEDPGTSLGFGRDIINIGPFGFTNPFSRAGAEGMHQWLDQFRLRLRGGINGEQAQQINAATAGSGFSGQQGADIRMDFMAPLVQRYGLNAENLAPFLQVLRTGTGTIDDLNRVLGELGEGARSARMPVDAFTQSVAQLGEQMQAQGGTFLGGAQLGTQFAQSTGLNPGVAGTLMQNPVVQGYVAARTGLPTTLAGSASPLAQQRSMEQALRDRVAAFKGTMPSHREPIRDIDGNVVDYEVTSGRDAEIAAAAQSLGINQEQAKQMMNHQGTFAAANFDALSRNFEGRTTVRHPRGEQSFIDRLNRSSGGNNTARLGAHGTGGSTVTLTGPTVSTQREYKMGKDGRVMYRIGHTSEWLEDTHQTEKMRQQLHGNDVAGVNLYGPGGLRGLHRMAMAAGVNQDDWNEVDKKARKGQTHEAMKEARQLVSDKVTQANADTNIAFTGAAEKFFKALVNQNKGLAGAGGLTGAMTATSNRGPNPLSNQTASAGALWGG
jgi:hypothetical protein